MGRSILLAGGDKVGGCVIRGRNESGVVGPEFDGTKRILQDTDTQVRHSLPLDSRTGG